VFRSKLKIIIIALATIFLSLLLVFCGLFVYGFPDHSINIALFKLTYNLTPTKKSFLEFYSPRRRDVANGDIPTEVDEFLCRRIENASEEELSAIVNFYTIQAAGREGACIYKTSEPTKEKIIEELVKRLKDNSDLYKKIVLLEEIRLGKSLGKGAIHVDGMNRPTSLTLEEDKAWRKKYKEWFDNQLETTGKTKVQEWWNSKLSWEEKKKTNPFQGSNIKVFECCG
jgi:hypothetical protein